MDHSTYFPKFLTDKVNINQTRLDTLSNRVDSVYTAIRADPDIGDLILGKIPQGSWPHRTIIRPRSGGDFDADFLLHIDWVDGWSDNPREYPNAVYRALDHHTTYSKLDHGRRARSVYLNYAPENGIGCHLDIVPFVTHPYRGTVIVNRDANDWESSNPQGFTDWIKRMDAATNGNFRTVVRLMKYYKVHKGSFGGVKSVILTTLLGEQVNEWAAGIDPTRYSDIPTTLVDLVEKLDEYLRNHPIKPSLPNPSNDGTNFDHRWTQETYSHFAGRMAVAAADMRAALDEPDFEKSVTAWQKIFGDGFQPSPSKPNPVAPPTTGALGSLSGRSGKSG
ncbi:MAG TPA: hypothetical protein PLV93_07000 [Microthrixaceae bacterium]|nr:hypothetical protein [Microthrixaceae bacterium]